MKKESRIREMSWALESFLEGQQGKQQNGVSAIDSPVNTGRMQQLREVGRVRARYEMEMNLENRLRTNMSGYDENGKFQYAVREMIRKHILRDGVQTFADLTDPIREQSNKIMQGNGDADIMLRFKTRLISRYGVTSWKIYY